MAKRRFVDDESQVTAAGLADPDVECRGTNVVRIFCERWRMGQEKREVLVDWEAALMLLLPRDVDGEVVQAESQSSSKGQDVSGSSGRFCNIIGQSKNNSSYPDHSLPSSFIPRLRQRTRPSDSGRDLLLEGSISAT